MIGAKLLHISFDHVDGFIRVYYGIRYSVLVGGEKYDFISNRIRYSIIIKSSITYVFSHNYDSYDSLPLEKTLTLL